MPEGRRPFGMKTGFRPRGAVTPRPPGAPLGCDRARRQGYVLGRVLLFVPVLALLGFTLWQRAEGPSVPTTFQEPSEPERTGAVAAIDGWEGRVQRDGAAPLRVRLERLHPEKRRQAYDAKALFRTVRMAGQGHVPEDVEPDGEPWRLTLSVAARPGSAASLRAPVLSNLGDVRLGGLVPVIPETAAASVAAEPSGGGARTRAALIALLTFPEVPLLEGESHSLVFWGRAPEGSVLAHLPGHGDLELMAKTRSAARASDSIARLDARGGQVQPR